MLNYTESGDFKEIQVEASNIYNKATRTVKVQFPAEDNTDGIKWYIVVIIVALALIVIGTSYGMYLKMQKSKKDKKVSLLSETEEIDEVV